MKIRFCLFFLILSLSARMAYADLKVGDLAPHFSAQASLAGKAFDYQLAAALRQGPVVVYFYPTAFGGGCSVQARAFAVNHDKFAAAGATIVGVSLDDINRLNEFSADPQYCAGKFPVAADESGKIANSYGLTVNESTRGRKDNRGVTVNHGSIARTTFVLDAAGRVAAVLGDLKPAENVARALQAVRELAPRQASRNAAP